MINPDMIYTVTATKRHKYDSPVSFANGHIVYQGHDFNKARKTMLEYVQFCGCEFKSEVVQ